MKKAAVFLAIIICASALQGMIFEGDYDYAYINYLQRSGALNLYNNDMPLTWDDVSNAFYNGNATDNDRAIFDYIKTHNAKTTVPRISGNMNISVDHFTNININSSISLSAYIGPFYCISELFSQYPYGDTTYVNLMSVREWNNTSSRVSKAFIAYSKDNLTVIGGRFLPAMGRGVFDNMFLSSRILSPDGIYFRYRKSIWDFAYYAATLTPGHSDFRDDLTRKYVSLHKLGLKLPYSTYIAFKELIIYRTLMPQLRYLNPFTLYYGIQWNTHSDDNVVWSVELINNYFEDWTFSGELFIDDFVYEKELTAIFNDFQLYAPDKTGFLFSVSYAPAWFDGLLVEGEYARVNKYTGTHRFPENAYSYYNEPALYYIGPDADIAGIKISYMMNTVFNATFTSTYTRKGEGRITDAFVELSGQDYEYAFPSGIVMHTIYSELSLQYRYGMGSLSAKVIMEASKNSEAAWFSLTPTYAVIAEIRI